MRTKHRVSLSAAMVVSVLAFRAAAARAECTWSKSDAVYHGDTIGILIEADAVRPALIDEAIGNWQACREYGTGFPALLNGVTGTRVVTVRFVAGSSGTARCAGFLASTITLYAVARFDGRPVRCAAAAQILAHELGHVLGLADAEGAQCRGRIMSRLDRGHRQYHAVSREECELVARKWVTFAEAVQPAAEPAAEGTAQRASEAQHAEQVANLGIDAAAAAHHLPDLLP